MEKKPSEMSIEEFNAMINEPPPYTRKDSDTGYEHIPIGYLEEDLRICFEGMVVFQKTPNQQIFNAVDCDVHLLVYHPVLKVWMPAFHGTGTCLIERIEQGKYADTTKVVKANDESLATHSAFAEGKKSAAKGIGPRFGSNLNRENAPGKKATAYDDVKKLTPAEIKKLDTKLKVLKAFTSGAIDEETQVKLLSALK